MPSVAEVYQTNRAISTSPLSRLLSVYDFALRACENQRLEDLSRGLRVLMESLDFGYPVAAQLASLYEWCATLGRQQRFSEAAHLLQELRDTWAEAGRNTEAVSQVSEHVRDENITAIV